MPDQHMAFLNARSVFGRNVDEDVAQIGHFSTFHSCHSDYGHGLLSCGFNGFEHVGGVSRGGHGHQNISFTAHRAQHPGVTVAVAVSVGVALGGSGVAVKVAVAGTAVNVAVATIGNGVAVAVAACVVHVAVGWMTAVWVAATAGCVGGCVGWTTAVAAGGSVSVGSTKVVAVSTIAMGCVGSTTAVVFVPVVFIPAVLVQLGIAVATSGGAVSVAISVLLSGSLLLTCVAVSANVGV